MHSNLWNRRVASAFIAANISWILCAALSACGEDSGSMNDGSEVEADAHRQGHGLQSPAPISNAGSDQHVRDLIAALNGRLEGCTLRLVGRVGDPDSAGKFRFYLDAVYTKGAVDGRVHFESYTHSLIEHDVDALLKAIPNQVFRLCQHRNAQPPADGQLALHVRKVIEEMNLRLEGCVLYQEGEPRQADSSGYADYYLNARYADGASDSRRRFRATLAMTIEAHVEDLSSRIPTMFFRKCRVRYDPSVHIHAKVAQIIAAANGRLEHCVLMQVESVGAVDADGFAEYAVKARYDDGTFDTVRRFRIESAMSVDEGVEDLISLVPTVVFRGCSMRGTPPSSDVADPVEMLKDLVTVRSIGITYRNPVGFAGFRNV